MTTAMMEKQGSAVHGDEHWAQTRLTLYQLLSEFIIYKPSVHLTMKWRRKLEHTLWNDGAFLRFRSILAELEPSSLRPYCTAQAREYERLIGRRRGSGIPLRESGYVRVEAGLAACRAGAAYDRAGVTLNRTSGEKDDELSVELEFMAVLAERMIEGVRSRGERERLARMQLEFVQRHLLTWIPSFCEEMRAGTVSPLYLNLCAMLEAVLLFDRAWLSARVGD